MNPGQSGWFKALRDPAGLDLIKANKNAFVLLYVVAHRARWRPGLNLQGLGPGEALIGDFDEYNMSEREYRTAKKFLERHGLATFTATSKGTVATISKLCADSVFDISLSRTDGQPDGHADRQTTDARQADDGRPTTNEEGEEGKTGRTCVRLHGIPSTVEEVIAAGAALNPPVDEPRCRAFWAHYEGQRRISPNGAVFWITSGGAVVTSWLAKLPAFEGNNRHRTARQAHTENDRKPNHSDGFSHPNARQFPQ